MIRKRFIYRGTSNDFVFFSIAILKKTLAFEFFRAWCFLKKERNDINSSLVSFIIARETLRKAYLYLFLKNEFSLRGGPLKNPLLLQRVRIHSPP